jgi:hypothetical protein
MNNLKDSILSALGAFVISALTTVITVYFSDQNGGVVTPPPQNISGTEYNVIDVINFSDKKIDGLLISIPKALPIDKIISSNPIKYKKIDNIASSTDRTLLEISLIPSKTLTRIMFPSTSNSDNLKLINTEELGLSSDYFESNKFLSTKRLPLLFIPSIMVAIMFGLFKFYFDKQTTNLKERLVELDKSIHSLNERIQEASNQSQKAKLLLLARIRDYAKELDFWRDTIRKIITNRNTKQDADILFSTVTQKLSTWGTRPESKDFEAISVMADLIKDKQK